MREARLHLRPHTKPRPYLAVTSSVTPTGGMPAGSYDLGMLCVAAGSAQGYRRARIQLAASQRGSRDARPRHGPAALPLMAPFHLAETREQALANVRAGFEKYQLYAYSVNPEGGAAIGLPSIEVINEGGRGVIGTPDDALGVLENYWAKTGGFGSILLLAHNWADWAATKRSYELFARYVLPRFEERNRWRSELMDWMRGNREGFSAKRKDATAKAVEKHFAEKRSEEKRR